MSLKRLPTLGVAVMVAAGCYRYVPASLDTIPERTHVRALVSTEEQVRLQERIGLTSGMLTGEIISLGRDSVLVAVRSVTPNGPGSGQTLFQRVDIPRSRVLRVDRREIDPIRVGGLGALVAGSAVFVILQLGGDRNPGAGPDPDPGTQDQRTRLPLSIAIP